MTSFRSPAIDRHASAIAAATARPEPRDLTTLTPEDFRGPTPAEHQRLYTENADEYRRLRDAS